MLKTKHFTSQVTTQALDSKINEFFEQEGVHKAHLIDIKYSSTTIDFGKSKDETDEQIRFSALVIFDK